MSGTRSQISPQSRAPYVRARMLVLVLSVVGVLCGIVTLVAEGHVRTGFGAATLVLLITAAYCAFAAWFESLDGANSDIDAPPPAVALPQSPVTQIYDPPLPPSQERTREE